MDILSFLKDHGIDFVLSGRNLSRGRVGACCPHCRDTGYHGAFTADGEFFSCWRCGAKNVNKTLQLMTGMSYYEVNKELSEYDGSSAIMTIERKKPQGTEVVLPGGPLERVHQRYLIDRGFDPDKLEKKHGIRGTGMTGEWKYRIILPLMEGGRCVSYTTRDYTGKQELRYKTLPIERSIANPKHSLYGDTHLCGTDKVIVSEGPFDALKLGDGAVATLGTSYTPAQIRKLSIYEKVYIVFDPEEMAQKRALQLAQMVSALGSEVEVIDIGGDGDPGDMDEESVKKLRKELDFPIDEVYLNF
jgi:DNA primase